MKKLIPIAIIALFTITSCKKTPSEKTLASSKIYGKWMLTDRIDISTDSQVIHDINNDEKDDTYTFSATDFAYDSGVATSYQPKQTWVTKITYTSDTRADLTPGTPWRYFEIKSITENEIKIRPYYILQNGSVSNQGVDYEVLKRVN